MIPLLLIKVLLISTGPGLLAAANYSDTVTCEDFPDVANYSIAELEQEIFSQGGECLVYVAGSSLDPMPQPNPCNRFYDVGVDTFYLPPGRSSQHLYDFAASAKAVLDKLSPQCKEAATRALCYYYFPPCGNDTHFQPPNALCQEVCYLFTDDICQGGWQQALVSFQDVAELNHTIATYQLQLPDCTEPGESFGSLPHCCSDAGITRADIDSTATNTPTTDSEESDVTVILPTDSNTESSSSTELIVGTTVSVGVVLAVLLVAAVLVTLCCVARQSRRKYVVQQSKTVKKQISSTDNPPPLPGLSQVPSSSDTAGIRYAPYSVSDYQAKSPSATLPRVSFKYIRNMSKHNLIIPGRHIQLQETIGQGEFGVVYRGHLTGWERRTTAEVVAVKTLKSKIFSAQDILNLMKESEKMQRFRHPHILNLIGVCIDAGEAPYLVMPFMANGSLLTYLRKERPHLTIAEEAGEDMIMDAQTKLLSICLQIAKGMCYLAEQKFVHRDLAARNCMIDENFMIKVADFGLSEDIYSRNYFRQGNDADEEGGGVKLPIRWMAVESLLDSIFTEKTDVWSYGVTCWEVFSLGHTPYPVINPFALISFLQNGHRLKKPNNAACTHQVYHQMRLCWKESPDHRPSFSEIVLSLSTMLRDLSGYLDLNAVSPDCVHANAAEQRVPAAVRTNSLQSNRAAAIFTEVDFDFSSFNSSKKRSSRWTK